jgi:hypothetical protein
MIVHMGADQSMDAMTRGFKHRQPSAFTPRIGNQMNAVTHDDTLSMSSRSRCES